jgi:hypothetical protein
MSDNVTISVSAELPENQSRQGDVGEKKEVAAV